MKNSQAIPKLISFYKETKFKSVFNVYNIDASYIIYIYVIYEKKNIRIHGYERKHVCLTQNLGNQDQNLLHQLSFQGCLQSHVK